VRAGVTSFIESAAGVEAGGRTGLTGLVVAAMMMQNVTKIDWNDYTESVPAFLIIVGIPFSYSVADGLALGFISYAVVKGFSGRAREISWLTYLLAIVLVGYFVFVRGRMG
jgi:AGZA family xanthine/uracil permease-like MFS transporter